MEEGLRVPYVVASYLVERDGSFLVSGSVTVTSYVSGTANLYVSYTDVAGNAASFAIQGHFTSGYGTSISGVGSFEGNTIHFRAKAGTTINVSVVGVPAFNFTYNADVLIRQVA